MAIQEEVLEIPPPPRLDTFGQRLRYAREYRGLTGVELADRLGVPSQTLSTWERGSIPTRPDPFAVVAQLEEILKIDRNWLAWGISGSYPENLQFDLDPAAKEAATLDAWLKAS